MISPDTPLSDNAIEWDFPRYIDQLRLKLEKGKRDYGDSSLSLSPDRLIAELQAEALDFSGWGFLLWLKLERMRQKLQEQ